jgi:hypothetical protein
MRFEMPLLSRFLTRLIHDVLPAALASVIGGFLFTHFQLGQPMPAAVSHAGAAPAEMMDMLRDEHGLIVNFLNAQLATEKRHLADEDSDARAAAAAASAQRTAVAATTRPAPQRAKPPAATGISAISVPPPLATAHMQQNAAVVEGANEAGKPVAHNDDTIVAKTVGIKDHVVAVTRRVVSAIGGIPSWFGAIGDRIGGDDANPRPPASVVSAS